MKHVNMTPKLYEYMCNTSLREHAVLKALREETANHPLAEMQVAPEQAQFLQFLIRTIHAKKVLELGTFTGYSALAMALALPEDGKLITCDINAEWTRHTHDYWKQAGQQDKIELRLGAAKNTLEDLIASGYKGQFDFIFIDADKTNYVPYYEYALELIQPHGIIAIDNIFWEGMVVDPEVTNAQIREIRRLNQHIQQDERVDISLLAIADGLFLVKKKQD